MNQNLEVFSAGAFEPREAADRRLAIANDADPREADLNGVEVIELNFPKFSDGRAFSQAFLLRRRLGFTGQIRATGDVLIDQLVQMQRSGFSQAVLRADQDLAHGQASAGALPGLLSRRCGAHHAPLRRCLKHEGFRMNALSLYDKPSPDFAAKVSRAIALLRETAASHPKLTQASSLGAEDMVVTHLLHLADIDASVFVLETGKLHPETLALIPRIERRYGISVQVFRPRQESVVSFVRKNGEEAMYQSIELRKACCDIRKMEPLARALAGHDGWITGLRREQSNARAEVGEVIQEPDRIKISPLVEWTWGDVWHFIGLHALDYNALHDQFYPSIGCAPCTRAISVGEDFRAGRWWWEQESAKECGLHVQPVASSLVSSLERTPS